MDWSNERYVRLYTRDTDDWLALTWQAKAAFPLLLRKVDRSGFLATRRGAVGIAAQTGLPLEVCEVALCDLLRDGSVTECDGGYLMPNYIEAQEAAQSDAQRARESRERRRDRKKSHNQPATPRNVTEPSHAVTARHSSRAVPSVPSRTEPAKPEEAARAAEIAGRGGEQTPPAAAATPPGCTQLLNELHPSQRAAMRSALSNMAQGYDLPPGLGAPTYDQLDQACRECVASVPAHEIKVKRVRNFLIGVMRPTTNGESPPRKAGGAAGWDNVR